MSDTPPPRVWVLTDDKPGNRTQSIGVAQALPWPYEEKNLRLNTFSALPNRLLGATACTIQSVTSIPSESLAQSRSGEAKTTDFENRSGVYVEVHEQRQRRKPLFAASQSRECEWPDIAIAAGRRLVPALRYLKHRNPRCFTAYLMQPQVALAAFDLVAIPAHDDPPARANVIATTGAPHAVTPEKLAAAKAKWGFTLDHLPAPRIALLVGGNSASARYLREDFHELGVMAGELAEAAGGSLMVTTSRRTGRQSSDYLRLALAADTEFHHWHETSENPYYGFLALAEAVIVTGDSMSMCAEACALGKPVYIFAPRYGKLAPKLRRFHETLFARGLARPLTPGARLDWTPSAPLDEAGRIAAEITSRYGVARGERDT